MDIKAVALQIVRDRIDLAGIVEDLLVKVADEALNDLVTNSENKWDDMAKAALWPPLQAEIVRRLKEEIAKI